MQQGGHISGEKNNVVLSLKCLLTCDHFVKVCINELYFLWLVSVCLFFRNWIPVRFCFIWKVLTQSCRTMLTITIGWKKRYILFFIKLCFYHTIFSIWGKLINPDLLFTLLNFKFFPVYVLKGTNKNELKSPSWENKLIIAIFFFAPYLPNYHLRKLVNKPNKNKFLWANDIE